MVPVLVAGNNRGGGKGAVKDPKLKPQPSGASAEIKLADGTTAKIALSRKGRAGKTQQFCKNWQMGKRKEGADCPNKRLHLCAVYTKKGGPCGSKDHRGCNHPKDDTRGGR